MATERSDKCNFESMFGGGWITPAQYIAEIMCERIARKECKEIPLRFWCTDEWKRTFLLQLHLINSILKVYSYQAVIKALRTATGKKVFSLGGKWFMPYIEEEERKIQKNKIEQERAHGKEIMDTLMNIFEKPREAIPAKKSAIDRLKELE